MDNKPKYLIPFLKAYKQWIADGAREDEPFTRNCGLCHNYSVYLESVIYARDESDMYEWMPRYVGKFFRQATLDEPVEFDCYPFAPDQCGSYHTNPRRLEWIDQTLEKFRD